MSSSLFLQQCPACLVCLTWIVLVMGGKWPYSYCFLGYCFQDLFNIAPRLLYGWTTWTLTKRMEELLDGSYTRMLRAIFNQ